MRHALAPSNRLIATLTLIVFAGCGSGCTTDSDGGNDSVEDGATWDAEVQASQPDGEVDDTVTPDTVLGDSGPDTASLPDVVTDVMATPDSVMDSTGADIVEDTDDAANPIDAHDATVPDAGTDTTDVALVSEPTPLPGDIVFTEFMPNPTGFSDANGEWIELVNTSGQALSLSDCALSDMGSDHLNLAGTVGDLTVPAGAYWLLATSDDATLNGGLAPNVVYGGFYLSNSSDTLVLECAGQVIDTVTYDSETWPLYAGHAIALDGELPVDASTNDSGDAWCAAPTMYAVGNYGTPGEANPPCPTPDNTVDACRLVSPEALVLLVGATFTITALVYDAEVTDLNPWVDTHPALRAEMGYGPQNADPMFEPASFTWFEASGTFGWQDTETPGWDQWEQVIEAPATGLYQVLSRFSLDEGETWTLCDLTGSDDGYQPSDAGQLVTGSDPCVDNPCALPTPPSCAADGTTVLTSLAPGSCAIVGLTYECTFDIEETNCAVAGGTCEAGACVGLAPPPGPGELIITEIMSNPDGIPDNKGEWFELVNLADQPLNLHACRITSGSDEHVIDNGGGLLVDPGDAILLARNGDIETNGGLSPDYVYANISLVNLTDELGLYCAELHIDTVTWGEGLGFPTLPGQAMQLRPDVLDADANDDGSLWCAADSLYYEGNTGSPGEANPPCPVADPCETLACTSPPADTCVLGVATTFASTGICTDGACTYPAASTDDCAADGLLCNDGMCTDTPDPCLPNPCSAPPEPLCEGDIVHVGRPSGACFPDPTTGEASCTYPLDQLDCSLGGSSCIEGACSGGGASPSAGAVVFSEFLVEPIHSTISEGQWIEIFNPGASWVDLSGCALEGEQTDPHILSPDGPFLFGPGEFRLLAASATPAFNGGIVPDYTYGAAIELSPSQGTLQLRCDDVTIDALSYEAGAWGMQSGVAWELASGQLNSDANDSPDAWCLAQSPYGKGDLGTPGTLGQGCPETNAVDWCRIEAPATDAPVLVGDAFHAVASLRESGITDASLSTDVHPWVRVQLAVGPTGTDPASSAADWTFLDAGPALDWTAAVGEPDIDRYAVDWTPWDTSTVDLAYRVSVDAGLTWTYCDRNTGLEGSDGSEDGYTPDNALRLEISPSPCIPNPCASPPAGACTGDLLTYSLVPGACSVINDEPYCAYTEAVMDCALYAGTCSAGACIDMATTPEEGEVIFTEIMVNPDAVSDAKGEWAELQNVSGHKVDLEGCVVRDEADDSHTIATQSTLVVLTDALFVIARHADWTTNGGFFADYEASLNLVNGSDVLILECGGQIIDRITYDSTLYPVENGAAMQLDSEALDAVSNDDAANWCAAQTPYGDGDLGTPGTSNTPCPFVDPCLEVVCDDPPGAACNGDVLEFPADVGTCVDGGCTYTIDSSVVCADTGQTCENAACVTLPNPVDWCRLQWPDTVTVFPDESVTVYGRYFESGLTDATPGVDASPLIEAQILLGPEGSDPTVDATDWNAWPAVPYEGWNGAEAGVDEVQAEVHQPMVGVYGMAMRITVDDGQTWTWCDRQTGPESDGSADGYQPDNAGHWETVTDPCDPNPCTTPPDATCEGQTLTTYDPSGTCDRSTGIAVCTYGSASLDCAGEGGACVEGACDIPAPAAPAAGDIVITELMTNPKDVSDFDGEWIELKNTSSKLLTLANCGLSSAGDPGMTLPDAASLVLKPSAYVVLSASEDPNINGGLAVDASYAGAVTLSNITDTVTISCEGMVIDSVTYDETTHPDITGRAMQLAPGATDVASNDDGVNWCAAYEWYGDGDDRGTPGMDNSPCVAPDAVDWCRLHWPAVTNAVEGSETTWYARFHEAGMTDLSAGVDVHGQLWVQVGYAADGTDLTDDVTDWSLFDATPNPAWEDSSEPGNDEYMGSFPAPVPGEWDVAFRISVDNGQTWTACDQDTGLPGEDGSEDGYQPERSATLVSGSDPCTDNPCYTPPDANCEADVLHTWELPGTCTVDGLNAVCDFAPKTVDCAALGGACEAQSCIGVPTTPGPGDLKLVEFMHSPTKVPASDGVWLEYRNMTAGDLELTGCELVIGNQSYPMPETSQVVPAEAVFVIASNEDEDTNGGLIPDLAIPTLVLSSADTTYVFECLGETVNTLEYIVSIWPGAAGASVQLTIDSEGYDEPIWWCLGTQAYGDGDLGTPGSDNTDCTP